MQRLAVKVFWDAGPAMGISFIDGVTDALVARTICLLNGRIDNLRQVAAQVNCRPNLGAEATLIEAWRKWGVDCASKMIGEFAFVIVDGASRTVYSASDHIGIRCAYYWRRREQIVVGFSMDAVRRLVDPMPRPDEAEVMAFVLGLCDQSERTVYADVTRLQGGHWMSVDQTRLRCERYWNPAFGESGIHRDLGECAEGLREVFKTAVSDRFSAYPRVGSMLSGGLDSSSIVAMARMLAAPNGDEVSAYAGVFPGLSDRAPRSDERPWMRAVSAQGGLRYREVALDSVSLLENSGWQHEELDSHPNLYLELEIFRLAAADGISAVCSGNDGDTVVGYGFNRLYYLLMDLRLVEFCRQVTALRRLRGKRYRRIVWQFGLSPVLQKLTGRSGRIDNIDLIGGPIGAPVNRARAVELGLPTRIIAQAREDARWYDSEGELTVAVLKCAQTRRVLGLLRKAGEISGVAVVLPFMDRRVIEYCIGLPDAVRLSGGYDRAVMREAMRGILPDEVRQRWRKQDISLNATEAFLERDLVRARAWILDSERHLAPYYDMRALETLLTRISTERRMEQRELFVAFNAAVLAAWLGRVGTRGRLD